MNEKRSLLFIIAYFLLLILFFVGLYLVFSGGAQ